MDAEPLYRFERCVVDAAVARVANPTVAAVHAARGGEALQPVRIARVPLR